jgi:hypothetical protein
VGGAFLRIGITWAKKRLGEEPWNQLDWSVQEEVLGILEGVLGQTPRLQPGVGVGYLVWW